MFDEVQLVVQLAVGLVFLLSASAKLTAPTSFARGVAAYDILPEALATVFGLLLIPIEVFVAVSHLTGWLLNLAAPLGLIVLAGFAVAVTINLRRGRALPCYCFGSQTGEKISGRTLARLLLLIAGEVMVLAQFGLSQTSQLTYPDRVARVTDLGLLVFWSTFLLISGFWLLSAPEVVALVRNCVNCGKRAVNPRSAQNGTDNRS